MNILCSKCFVIFLTKRLLVLHFHIPVLGVFSSTNNRRCGTVLTKICTPVRFGDRLHKALGQCVHGICLILSQFLLILPRLNYEENYHINLAGKIFMIFSSPELKTQVRYMVSMAINGWSYVHPSSSTSAHIVKEVDL